MRNRRGRSVLLVPCLALFLAASLASAYGAGADVPIEFSPPSWKYGMIQGGDVARTRVEAINRGAATVEVTFVPTCDCLSVSPPSRKIAPGGRGSFELAFDSKDDIGITERGYVVTTDIPGAKRLYYLLTGVVRVDRPAAPARAAPPGAATSAGAARTGIPIRYYYTPGCRSCENFLRNELPTLEARYGISVAVERRDLLDASAYEELAAYAASIGEAIRAIPALRVGERLLQGEAEIRDLLPGLLLKAGSGGAWQAPSTAPSPAPVARPPVSAELAAFPVMVAGLVDGINPCAFTTLIFLLASLALAGRGRREVLVIGALFSLGVFLTYVGIGFGLFAALRAAGAVAVVAVVLRWALFAALLAFAALSVYDYLKIRAGKASEILLQLPTSIKLRIHASIRTRVRTAALAGSSLGLGFLVSIFEFACTGQVYLPTLAYLARGKGNGSAVLLLLLYNLCFILPLLAVFAATYLGASSKRITAAFQKRMGAVKLGLAGVFLILAILTIAT